MRCPKCSHHKTGVYDSRDLANGEARLRRRKCIKCKHRFFTTEIKNVTRKKKKTLIDMVAFRLDVLSQGLMKDIKIFVKE